MATGTLDKLLRTHVSKISYMIFTLDVPKVTPIKSSRMGQRCRKTQRSPTWTRGPVKYRHSTRACLVRRHLLSSRKGLRRVRPARKGPEVTGLSTMYTCRMLQKSRRERLA